MDLYTLILFFPKADTEGLTLMGVVLPLKRTLDIHEENFLMTWLIPRYTKTTTALNFPQWGPAKFNSMTDVTFSNYE